MDQTQLIIDMKVGRDRDLLWGTLRTLRDAGKKIRVIICEHRARRTDRQNRFYHPAFVVPFAEFLRAQGQTGPFGSLITDQEAHEILKFRFLRKTIYDPKTGEMLGDVTGSTTELTTVQFNAYLDRINDWLSRYCGFPHIEPKDYHERETPATRRLDKKLEARQTGASLPMLGV